MFTFHCKSGDIQVEKADVVKYGELLKDIASETDELAVDFEKSDMEIVLHFAYTVYYSSAYGTIVHPPCTLYHIFDFFCMTKLTDPTSYYEVLSTMHAVELLISYTNDKTSPKYWMNSKLYCEILSSIRDRIRYGIETIFNITSRDSIYGLLVKLGVDDDNIILKMLNHYDGGKAIVDAIIADRQILKIVTSDNETSKAITRYLCRYVTIWGAIARELVRALKNKDESIRGKVVLLTIDEYKYTFNVEMPGSDEKFDVRISFSRKEYDKCKVFAESLYA